MNFASFTWNLSIYSKFQKMLGKTVPCGGLIFADIRSTGPVILAIGSGNKTCGPDQTPRSSPKWIGRWRAGGSAATSAASPVGCGSGETVDGGRREAAASGGSSAGSPASWLGGDWRLERVRQRCAPVIRGGPIFLVSGVDDDGGVDINCAKLTNSQWLFPYCQMQ
jgi:hypothetical protein